MPYVIDLASQSVYLESDAPRFDSQRCSVLGKSTYLTLTVTLALKPYPYPKARMNARNREKNGVAATIQSFNVAPAEGLDDVHVTLALLRELLLPQPVMLIRSRLEL